MLDPLHDPHRGLPGEDIADAGPPIAAELAERLVLFSQHQPDHEPSSAEEVNRIASSASGLSWTPLGQPDMISKTLTHSWLLILFVAPLVIVLLVWLLVLLRRRAEQTLLLVNSTGCSHNGSSQHLCFRPRPASPGRHEQQKCRLNSCKEAKTMGKECAGATANAHYLLESSSSASASSSSTSSSTSSDTASTSTSCSAERPLDCSVHGGPGASQFEQPLVAATRSATVGKSHSTMRALVEHTSLYLSTITYQEIAACLVAFTIAIMNVVRMRNLFCCNLVMFVLITSRLLNLMTLTTFSVTKLIKLFKLKPQKLASNAVACSTQAFTTTSQTISQHVNKNRSNGCKQSSGSSSGKNKREAESGIGASYQQQELGARHGHQRPMADEGSCQDNGNKQKSRRQVVAQPTSSSTDAINVQADCATGDSNKFEIGNSNKQRRSASPFDASATTCRLITKETTTSSGAGKGGSGKLTSAAGSSPSCTLSPVSCSSLKSLGHGSSKLRRPDIATTGESIACKLLLLLLVSALLALTCLYLRLMPIGSSSWLLGSGPEFSWKLANKSKTPAATDWSISIYEQGGPTTTTTTSTTTEATTRYSSETNDATERQQPNYLATWSTMFQQSSQLRQLIEQYELQQFIHLLFDTHLQTSRFICTLSADNYAPAAKLIMASIYACLMLAILLLSVTIQQVGKRRLCQLEAAAGGFTSKSLYHLNHHHRHHQTKQDPLSLARNQLDFAGLFGGQKTDSNRKRYSQLLKQTMRHHQSSLEMSGRFNQWQQQRGRGPRLRNSSSLSSLLMPAVASSTSTGGCQFWSSVERGDCSGNGLSANQKRGRNSVDHQAPRRLGVGHAQSLANLTSPSGHRSSTRAELGSSKLAPAGKLSNSGGHLAWLPLGSAATVASLSNIGRSDGSASSAAAAADDAYKRMVDSSRRRPAASDMPTCGSSERKGGVTVSTSAARSRQLSRRDRLGSIGENLVDCSDEFGSETAEEKLSCSHDSYDRHPFVKQPRYSSSSSNGHHHHHHHHLYHHAASSQTRRNCASHQHQQQQFSSSGQEWPASYCAAFGQSCQHQAADSAAKNQLHYSELRRDLRLAQAVILYSQLLNHAPILLLLVLANSLPDGLLASSWTSGHDNCFVWLNLLEALAFPLLLCAVDSRLALGLRRSLSCGATGNGPLYSAARKLATDSSSLRLLASNTGARLANQQQHYQQHYLTSGMGSHIIPPGANSTSSRYFRQPKLLLGPSSSHPDFMFGVYPTSGGVGQRTVGAQIAAVGCHTGPPYHCQLAKSSCRAHQLLAQEQPLAVDTREDNFAMISKYHSSGIGATSVPFLDLSGPGSGRAGTQSYAELSVATNAAAAMATSGSKPKVVRKRRTSALLSATRRLLGLGHRPGGVSSSSVARTGRKNRQGSARRLRSSEPDSSTASTTCTHADQTAASGGRRRASSRAEVDRMSPTSSLSTLIRKFNHDNYTSVCQQYEQRKQQIVAGEKRLQQSHQRDQQQQQQQQPRQEVLIDGLDESSEKLRAAEHTSKQAAAAGKNQADLILGDEDEEIFCRKGGLYYNYCLDDLSKAAATASDNGSGSKWPAPGKARVNPMMQASSSSSAGDENATGQFKGTVLLDVLGTSEPEPVNPRESSSSSHCAKDVDAKDNDNKPSSKQAASNEGRDKQEDFISKSSVVEPSKKDVETQQKSSQKVEPQHVGKSGEQQRQAPVSSGKTNNNNETIISNITSVQELLDKMNGIMAKQEGPDGCDELRMLDGSKAKSGGRTNKGLLEMVTKNSGEDKSDRRRDSTCANQLRQLAAMEPLDRNSERTADSNSLHYLQPGDSNQRAATATEAVAGNRLHQVYQPSLDYATLRSVDDALSLVSVSSEFEYHNIQHPLALIGAGSSRRQSEEIATREETSANGVELTGNKSPTTSVQVNDDAQVTASPSTSDSKIHWTQQQNSRFSGETKVIDAPVVSKLAKEQGSFASAALHQPKVATPTSSTDSKRLGDLRFPSFLPTKDQPTVVGSPMASKAPDSSDQSRSRSQQPNAARPSPASMVSTNNNTRPQVDLVTSAASPSRQQLSSEHQPVAVAAPKSSQPAGSSSLLNLTTAKFAALNSAPGGAQSSRSDQRPGARSSGSRLPARSSNTITKQRGRVGVSLAELGDGGASGIERSLNALENGNVRARIRRYQQSTNLLDTCSSSDATLTSSTTSSSTSGTSQAQLKTKNHHRHPQSTSSSMIPVTSKLPVPVSGHQQASRASQHAQRLSQRGRTASSNSNGPGPGPGRR